MIKVKRIYIALTAAAFCLSLSVARAQQQDPLALLGEKYSKIREIRADFVQERESQIFEQVQRQTGKMEYCAPSTLVWEYISPVSMKIDLGNGDNKALQGLGTLIVGTINGSIFTDTRNFDIKCSAAGDRITVSLVPRTPKLKKMFAGMSVELDSTGMYAHKVEMLEAGGDITRIFFSNQKLCY